jgi:hypothetical protein
MSDPLELEQESNYKTENVNMANMQVATDEIKINQEKETKPYGADFLMNQAKKKDRARSPSRESNHSRRSDRSRNSQKSYKTDSSDEEAYRKQNDIDEYESDNERDYRAPVNTVEENRMSREEEEDAKREILYQMNRLEKRGIKLPKKFNVNSDYQDMKYEYDRIMRQREEDTAIRSYRKYMMMFVTGAEFLNNKWDPFNLELDGWGESVQENVEDYDDIFAELHEKYRNRAKMSPEFRLLFQMAGSAFMFHLSNTMFKSALPSAAEVMKNNPDLMEGLGNAARQTFNGANMNGPMGGGMPPSMGGLIGDMLGDAFGNKANRLRQQQSTGPIMKGPDDINDIVNDVEGVDRLQGIEAANSDDDVSTVKSIDINGKKKRGGRRKKKKNEEPGITVNL